MVACMSLVARKGSFVWVCGDGDAHVVVTCMSNGGTQGFVCMLWGNDGAHVAVTCMSLVAQWCLLAARPRHPRPDVANSASPQMVALAIGLSRLKDASRRAAGDELRPVLDACFRMLAVFGGISMLLFVVAEGVRTDTLQGEREGESESEPAVPLVDLEAPHAHHINKTVSDSLGR